MTQLNYVIMFVDDVAAAITFYRDVVGFKVRFESPEWSELETGATTLALHKSSVDSPAGTVKLGVGVPNVDAFHAHWSVNGVRFLRPPADVHGQRLSEFVTPWGAHMSVSSPSKAHGQ